MNNAGVSNVIFEFGELKISIVKIVSLISKSCELINLFNIKIKLSIALLFSIQHYATMWLHAIMVWCLTQPTHFESNNYGIIHENFINFNVKCI